MSDNENMTSDNEQTQIKQNEEDPAYESQGEVSKMTDISTQSKAPRRLPAFMGSSSKVAPADVDPVNEKPVQKENEKAKQDSSSNNGSEDSEEKEKEEKNAFGAMEVFKFADCWDIILMVFGSICACAHGAGLPSLIILFGKMTDVLVDHGQYSSILDTISTFLASVSLSKAACISNPAVLSSHLTAIAAQYPTVDTAIIQKQIDTDFLDTMATFAIILTGMGCGVILLGYCQMAFWSLAAERQAHRIRKKFLQNVLRQEIGWFDVHNSGELNTHLADDISKIQEGIGDNLGDLWRLFSGFITGFVIGFVYGWKLTLVILSVSFLLFGVSMGFQMVLSSVTTKELKAYAKAGAVAEEVLGSVRTVVAFGGQKKECDRYSVHLEGAKAFGIKKSIINGLSIGFVYMVFFLGCALYFWYGAKLVRDEPDNYTIGTTLIVFFAVLIGAIFLIANITNLQSYATARGAAYTIYQIIDLVPEIDTLSEAGKKPDSLSGNIKFSNVCFYYPARPLVEVLENASLDISKGQTVALVGSSGCGKSTIIQLIQRFYDPEEGEVIIDGNNVKDLNLRWFREHIGFVSQEPVLFATSIAENIRYGRDTVSQDEIEAAAKMANAHDFIMDLPERYNTLVGERGAQLSGGQKQRVAIARALVKDPKILLLDEATSALDTESESIVQEALDKARAGRTTIVVAHRLSTIKTADIICGFKDGVVTEQGTHEQLMQKGGVYKQLVTLQTQKHDAEEDALIAECTKPMNKDTTKKTLKTQKSTVAVVKTDSETKDDEKSKEDKTEEAPPAPFSRIMRMSAPEWYLIMFGCFVCLCFGSLLPSFAVILAGIVGVFSSTDSDYQETEIRKYALILVGIAVGSFLALSAQGFFFGKVGETLTLRLRKMAFTAMLKQEMAYFDDPKNSTGALTTRLSTEASQVHGAAGARLGNMIEIGSKIIIALIIAFIYGWKLTLVTLACFQIKGISGALQRKLLQGIAGGKKEALEGAGKIATEGIENIRTVAGLGMEDKVVMLYVGNLNQPYKAAIKKIHLTGLAFSISQAMMFFAYATSFYFGSYLVKESEMEFEDVFRVFTSIIFGGMAGGETNGSSFAPDAAKAQIAAGHLFKLFDRVPAIDSDAIEGHKPANYSGVVNFRSCRFTYPSHPDVEVLQGLTLVVSPGETLALVGASGCGKSTTIQLIERFYDPTDGVVEFDDLDAKTLNVQWLRAQVGIVSTKPVLFDCSIAENIAYGDNSRVVEMQEIIDAARSANIHQFIDSLPNGYDTNVGNMGRQLSGGQKQRVAIARVLVRNPKVLLLDEATSALDPKIIVQEAMEKARQGRTCIVIADRLSAIRNADKICVIKHGQVAEQGRHGDLMAKQGLYYKLNTAQASKA